MTQPLDEQQQVAALAAALKRAYLSAFPKARPEDWTADASFLLAALKDAGYVLVRREETVE